MPLSDETASLNVVRGQPLRYLYELLLFVVLQLPYSHLYATMLIHVNYRLPPSFDAC